MVVRYGSPKMLVSKHVCDCGQHGLRTDTVLARCYYRCPHSGHACTASKHVRLAGGLTPEAEYHSTGIRTQNVNIIMSRKSNDAGKVGGRQTSGRCPGKTMYVQEHHDPKQCTPRVSRVAVKKKV